MLKQEKTTRLARLNMLFSMPLACAFIFSCALMFSSVAARAQDTSKHVPPPPPPKPADSPKAAPKQVRFPPPIITKNPAKPPKAPSHKKKNMPPPPPALPVERVKKD